MNRNLINTLGQLCREARYEQHSGDDSLLADFHYQFPAQSLQWMSLDQYCTGVNSQPQNFCWWLEYGLQKAIGPYRVGSARSHLLYLQADDQYYVTPKLCHLPIEQAMQTIAQSHQLFAIADTRQQALKLDHDQTAMLRISNSRKLRLLNAYHPNTTLTLTSAEHMSYFLQQFGLHAQAIEPHIIARHYQLFDYYCLIRDQFNSQLTPYGFSQLLYDPQSQLWPPAKQQTTIAPSGSTISNPLNQILCGAPGTGKTYQSQHEAVKIIDPDYYQQYQHQPEQIKYYYDQLCDVGRIGFVTFHQSLSYEDFIEGLKAVSNDASQITYIIETGIFKQLCQQAAQQSEPYVLIIDEINRGNISGIFGELLTLIEPNKRAGCSQALSATLAYSKQRFSVPNNLYIIATMNTADRSLTVMDTALRRRFEFRQIQPNAELFAECSIEGIDIARVFTTLNARLELLYDSDHQLGHSYFMPLLQTPTLSTLAALFETQIIPLLKEYFFDDWEKIRLVLADHKKPADLMFIQPSYSDETLQQLFGQHYENYPLQPAYHINKAALNQASAYIKIYD